MCILRGENYTFLVEGKGALYEEFLRGNSREWEPLRQIYREHPEKVAFLSHLREGEKALVKNPGFVAYRTFTWIQSFNMKAGEFFFFQSFKT